MDWILGEPIGEGAFARVSRCRRPDDPRVYALKRASNRVAGLLQEIEVLRRLHHPAIPRLVDAGTGPDDAWLVMDLVNGPSLLELRRPPGLPEAVVLGIAARLAGALDHAHGLGVAHRDVKPENVVLDEAGRAFLLDFGAASADPAAAPGERPVTPAYAPPEWFTGEGSPYVADGYALGVVCHELLAGRPAFPRVRLDELGPLKASLGRLPFPAAPDGFRWLAALTDPDPALRPPLSQVARALAEFAPVRFQRLSEVTVGGDPVGSEPVEGTVDRYVLRSVIGRGGMGLVYRAWDPALARDIALKRLRGYSPQAAARFAREARAVARIAHPGIVRMLDVGEDAAGPWMAMEWIEGPSLAVALESQVTTLRGGRDPSEALAVGIAVGEALCAAHAAGVIHRDVKPANILLESGTTPRLVDFGVALVADHTNLTQEAQVVGTPGYMAPEQARGGPIDARTDVWGLGAVIYALATGGPPPPRGAGGAVPGELGRICERALHPEANRRYPDMASLVADLRQVERGGVARNARAARRSVVARAGLLAGAGVAAALLLASGLSAWGTASAETAASARWSEVRDRAAQLRQQGDDAGAIHLFEAFVALPENQGTAALARAWLEESAHRADPVPALAEGWLAADGAPEREAVLGELARAFLRQERWESTAGALALADRAGVSLPPDVVQSSLLALRRSSQAALPPIAERMRRGTPLPERVDRALPADLDGDGDDELLLWEPDGTLHIRDRWDRPGERWAALGPGWGAVQVVELRPFGRVLVGARADGVEGWVLSSTGAPPAPLVRVSRAALDELHVGTAFTGFTAVDLDGDGRDTLYVSVGGYDRDLVELRPEGDPPVWRLRRPHPPTASANSLVFPPISVPERRQLLIPTGPWGGFDLRLFAAGEPSLALVARRKVGKMLYPQALSRPDGATWFAVFHPSGEGSVVQFPDDAPEGEPPGLYLVDPDLRTRWSLPGDCVNATLSTGDFDGNGAPDVARGCEGNTMFIGLDRGGVREQSSLGWTRVVAVGDADGDGDDEALVLTRTEAAGAESAWILGAGDRELPPLELAAPAAEVPPGLKGQAATAWERGEDLVRMGLLEEARAYFRRLAGSDPTGHFGALAHQRTAELAHALQDPEDAVDEFRLASQDGALSRSATVWAANMLAQSHRFADAAAMGEARGPDVTPLLQRAATYAAAPVLELRLGEGLDERVRLELPPAWPRTAQGLPFAAVRTGTILELPVRRVSERVGVGVDLRLDRVEWGAGVEATLAPADGDGPTLVVDLTAGGGGGQVGRYGMCRVSGAWAGSIGPGARPEPGPPEDLTASVEVTLDPPHSACRYQGQGWSNGGFFALPQLEGAAAGRDYVLRINSTGRPGAEVHTLVAGLLRSITLVGFERREWRADEVGRPGDARRWAYAASAALAPADDLLGLFAAEDRDQWSEADARARRLAATGDAEELALLLRTRSRLAAALRAGLGARWPAAFHEAWSVAATVNPYDELVWRAYTEQLGPLDPRGDPAVLAALEARRAYAWRRLGRVDRAQPASLAAEALARSAPVREPRIPTPPLVVALGERAKLAATRDPAQAVERLLEALQASPSPEVLADALAVDEDLTALHAEPGWARILAARGPIVQP